MKEKMNIGSVSTADNRYAKRKKAAVIRLAAMFAFFIIVWVIFALHMITKQMTNKAA